MASSTLNLQYITKEKEREFQRAKLFRSLYEKLLLFKQNLIIRPTPLHPIPSHHLYIYKSLVLFQNCLSELIPPSLPSSSSSFRIIEMEA